MIRRRFVRTGVVRAALLVLGLLLTAIAAVGAFLPLLPTTPFLLLAAACFVRSSPTIHRRLLESRTFGPYIAQWQRDRTLPREAKWKAYALVGLTFAISIAVVDLTWVRIVLAVLGAGLLVFLARLPTTARSEATEPPDDLRSPAAAPRWRGDPSREPRSR